MREWNIRHLPVLEGTVLVGMISDRDVLLHASQKEAAGGQIEVQVPRIPVHKVMSRGLLTCRPTSTVSYVAGLMVEQKIDPLGEQAARSTEHDRRKISAMLRADTSQLDDI
jgi:CBS domain-containing protein